MRLLVRSPHGSSAREGGSGPRVTSGCSGVSGRAVVHSDLGPNWVRWAFGGEVLSGRRSQPNGEVGGGGVPP